MPDDDKKPTLMDDLEEIFGNEKAQKFYDHVKELRDENKTLRESNKGLKSAIDLGQVDKAAGVERARLEQERDAALAKAAEMERDNRKAEEKKLEEQKEYKKLWESEQANRAEELKTAQQTLVNAELKAAALSKGIAAKHLALVMKLAERNGIVVDATGKVAGAEQAIDRLMAENQEVFDALKPKAADPTTTPAEPAEQNPADTMVIPGTNMTYKQYAEMSAGKTNAANAAGTPRPVEQGGKPKDQLPDTRKMTKQEADAFYQNLIKSNAAKLST